MLAYVFKSFGQPHWALTTYENGSNLPKCPDGEWVLTSTRFDADTGPRVDFDEEAVQKLRHDGYWVSYRESDIGSAIRT